MNHRTDYGSVHLLIHWFQSPDLLRQIHDRPLDRPVPLRWSSTWGHAGVCSQIPEGRQKLHHRIHALGIRVFALLCRQWRCHADSSTRIDGSASRIPHVRPEATIPQSTDAGLRIGSQSFPVLELRTFDHNSTGSPRGYTGPLDSSSGPVSREMPLPLPQQVETEGRTVPDSQSSLGSRKDQRGNLPIRQ